MRLDALYNPLLFIPFPFPPLILRRPCIELRLDTSPTLQRQHVQHTMVLFWDIMTAKPSSGGWNEMGK